MRRQFGPHGLQHAAVAGRQVDDDGVEVGHREVLHDARRGDHQTVLVAAHGRADRTDVDRRSVGETAAASRDGHLGTGRLFTSGLTSVIFTRYCPHLNCFCSMQNNYF